MTSTRASSNKVSFAISLQKTQFQAIASEDLDFVEKMRKMARMGFNGVELAIRDPSAIDVSEVKKGLGRSGLIVPAIGTGQAYLEEGLSLSHADKDARKAAVRRIRSHIELASQLGAMVIIGLIRCCPDKKSPVKDVSDWFKESLVTCLDCAEEAGIYLALEPVNRYECSLINSVIEGVAFAEELRHPRLKLLADTFHMNIEDRDFGESLKKAKPWLGHVHFADSNRRFPGSGHINFKEILATLRDIGYNEFISGEMLPKPTEMEAMEGFLSFMRNITHH